MRLAASAAVRAFAIASFLAFAGAAAAQEPQPTACDYADLLIDAGMTAEADKKLDVIAKDAANRDCVESSIGRLAAKKALEEETDLEASFQHVRELAGLGLESEALTELQAVLKANKGAAAPKDLRYLSGGGWKFWRDTRHFLHVYAIPVGEMVVAFALLLIILHMLWRWLYAKPLLRFEDFIAVNSSGGIHHNVKAMMQASYQRFERGRGGTQHRIDGNLEGVSLPGAVQKALPTQLQSPFVQAIPALVEKILPRCVFSVTGHLLDSETKGAGITVLVTSNKHHSASVTMWESRFRAGGKPREEVGGRKNTDQAGDFEELAEYAAIWLLFTIAGLYGPWPSRYFRLRGLRARMGTEVWQAYAMFRAALSAEIHKKPDDARELYVSAIRRDPNLSIAKFNLAWEAYSDDIHYAKTMWKQCIRRFWFWPTSGTLNEHSHFASMYGLAVRALDNRKEKGEREEGLKWISRLMRDLWVRRRVLSLRTFTPWDSRPEFRLYLRRLERLAITAQACLEVANGEQAAALQRIERVARHDSPLPAVNYNLACACSMYAEGTTDIAERTTFLDLSVKYLRLALWMDPEIEDLSKDTTLEFVLKERKDQIDKFTKKAAPPSPSPRLPLAAYKDIGARYAKLLADQGATTGFEFLRKAKTPGQRKDLADLLKIGREKVDKWAFAVELAEIPGIEIEDLDLLTAAGIEKVADLRRAEEDALLVKLGDWGKTLGVSDLPGRSVVELWIKSAKNQAKLVD